jgi:transcriptional regulator with XRE-family HTH domain
MRNHPLFGLKEMRERRGTPASQLAAAIGCSRNSYYRFENGERRITLDRACVLADTLRCTLDELRGRETADIVVSAHDDAGLPDWSHDA